MKLPEFSHEVWDSKYRYYNENTLEEFWLRIAQALASTEKNENKQKFQEIFYDELKDFKNVLGGRIMANIGIPTRNKTTLLNCFVHHPKDIGMKDPDSIEGIYTLLKAQALTLKSEGGYGTNFSFLRPAGTYIKGIGSRTPGVCRFMDLWNESSKVVTSGFDKETYENKKNEEKKHTRKGAQLGVLNIWHPEIKEFIRAKQIPNKWDKFNVSVGNVKGFMEAVLNNENWDLIFPDVSFEKYESEWDGDINSWKEKGYPIKTYEKVKAKDLYDEIMLATYTRNEPGFLFFDIVNLLNPISYIEEVEAAFLVVFLAVAIVAIVYMNCRKTQGSVY
jgi:ribonucleoside-diphosphate reductase alpha chain